MRYPVRYNRKFHKNKRPKGLDALRDLLPDETNTALQVMVMQLRQLILKVAVPYNFIIWQIARNVIVCITPDSMLSVKFG